MKNNLKSFFILLKNSASIIIKNRKKYFLEITVIMPKNVGFFKKKLKSEKMKAP